MKYLVLIYHNAESRAAWDGFSDDERAVGLRHYATLNSHLVASGELVAAEALADPSMGRRVGVVDGRTTSTDGPFAEAKEQLAGFYLVEVEDEARAIEIAGRIPEAGLGLVEVRPIMTYAGMEM